MIAEEESLIIKTTKNIVEWYKAELISLFNGDSDFFMSRTNATTRRKLRELGVICLNSRYYGYKVSSYGISLIGLD